MSQPQGMVLRVASAILGPSFDVAETEQRTRLLRKMITGEEFGRKGKEGVRQK